MSEFFRHAKERLIGDTNVADEYLQRLTSKYLYPEQGLIQNESKSTDSPGQLVGTVGTKGAAAGQQ